MIAVVVSGYWDCFYCYYSRPRCQLVVGGAGVVVTGLVTVAVTATTTIIYCSYFYFYCPYYSS